MDDIASHVEDNFGEREPDESGGKFFHMGLAERITYFLYDAVDTFIDVVVPETEDSETKIREVFSPGLVVFFVVATLPAIDFNDQLFFNTAKIDCVWAMNMITDKGISERPLFQP